MVRRPSSGPLPPPIRADCWRDPCTSTKRSPVPRAFRLRAQCWFLPLAASAAGLSSPALQSRPLNRCRCRAAVGASWPGTVAFWPRNRLQDGPQLNASAGPRGRAFLHFRCAWAGPQEAVSPIIHQGLVLRSIPPARCAPFDVASRPTSRPGRRLGWSARARLQVDGAGAPC